jgi:hypothetical protein
MTSGGVLRVTVFACCVLSGGFVAGGAVLGHAGLGVGVGAGLLLGSVNGYLIQALMSRGAPFVAASLLRLVGLSLIVMVAALVFKGSAWTIALGIGLAQLVMVAAGVRQGLRA